MVVAGVLLVLSPVAIAPKAASGFNSSRVLGSIPTRPINALAWVI